MTTKKMQREIAYQIDPVVWVREVLKVTPTLWQQEFLRAPQGGIHSGVDGTTGRQDHGRGVGDCARHAV